MFVEDPFLQIQSHILYGHEWSAWNVHPMPAQGPQAQVDISDSPHVTAILCNTSVVD